MDAFASGRGSNDACRRAQGYASLAVMARLLILLGFVLIGLGLLWGPIQRLGLGRLPGDIVIERESFRLYIPITSAILVSIVISAVAALVRGFVGR